MQIMVAFIILQINAIYQKEGDDVVSMPNRPYIIIYLIMHIISYILYYFRKRDIKLNGQPDANGVYTAKRESFISNIETFIMCIVIGFTVKHMIDMGGESFHREGIRSYFLVVDSIITFFYKPFIYFGMVIKVDGEIRKNLYTLYQK